MRRARAGIVLTGLAALPALAQDATTREVVIRDHRFEPAEIDVPAGQRVAIRLRNLDPTAEEFDSSALRIEKVVGAHGEGTVHLQPLAPGRYEFTGEYHAATARGVVVAK